MGNGRLFQVSCHVRVFERCPTQFFMITLRDGLLIMEGLRQLCFVIMSDFGERGGEDDDILHLVLATLQKHYIHRPHEPSVLRPRDWFHWWFWCDGWVAATGWNIHGKSRWISQTSMARKCVSCESTWDLYHDNDRCQLNGPTFQFNG